VPRVQVAAVKPVRFAPPIIAYGTVRPKRQIKVVPEVSGRLVEVHPDLAVGNVIRKGELLFRIDTRMYESRIEQIKAEIGRLEAELERHRRREQQLQKQLALAQRQQELTEKAVRRERELLKEGAAVEVELEMAEQRHLAQQEVVQRYQSELEMVPYLLRETQALLDIKSAQRKEAELNIEKATIYCPFDARVDAVGAQLSQVVTANFQIATLTDMEALELSVVVDPRDLQWVDRKAFASAVGEDIASAPEVEVTWTLWGRSFSWKGRITRLEKLDETTRTAHVIVELRDVMKILEQARDRKQMPLSVGMFCQARLPVEPLEGALVVPQYAIHDGQCVYVFEPDPDRPSVGRLVLTGDQVLVGFADAKNLLEEGVDPVTCQLKAGDQIILSPLPKAVPGMRLVRRDAGDAEDGGKAVACQGSGRHALARTVVR